MTVFEQVVVGISTWCVIIGATVATVMYMRRCDDYKPEEPLGDRVGGPVSRAKLAALSQIHIMGRKDHEPCRQNHGETGGEDDWITWS